MKDLEIKTSILFNLEFGDNAIFWFLFLFFLIIDSNFLIPWSIAQMFNTSAELVIPIGMPDKKLKQKLKCIQQLYKQK